MGVPTQGSIAHAGYSEVLERLQGLDRVQFKSCESWRSRT